MTFRSKAGKVRTVVRTLDFHQQSKINRKINNKITLYKYGFKEK